MPDGIPGIRNLKTASSYPRTGAGSFGKGKVRYLGMKEAASYNASNSILLDFGDPVGSHLAAELIVFPESNGTIGGAAGFITGLLAATGTRRN